MVDTLPINVVFRTLFGTPVTGLTPLITIYKTSGTPSTVVSAEAMTEIGNGVYVYNFTTRDQNEKYMVYIDGGAGFWIPWMRYLFKELAYYKDDQY
jgi:hypothetical protein